jgi:hypothetical protein
VDLWGRVEAGAADLGRGMVRREESRGTRGETGEEGLREEGDGVRVRVGCCVIYQGNTMRTIGSTIDGCKSLGRHGLLCLLFFFFFFPFYCTIVK